MMAGTAGKTLTSIQDIAARYGKGRDSLIPILQDIQAETGFLSPEAVAEVARVTGVSANEIYGVATFYTQFRFTPPGKHSICVCQGTACHVRGGRQILEEFESRLGVKPGETTADGEFDLERVMCVGCCALAPVAVVDGEANARMTPQKAREVISKYTAAAQD